MNSVLRHRNAQRQAGFGLLEVLVSLVIFAGVGFSLLAWFQQSVDTVERLRGFYELQDARKTALELLRSVNPSERPSGEQTLGSLRVAWVSQPDGDEYEQAGYPAGVGRSRMRLYQVSLSVYKASESQPWFVEKLSLLGSKSTGPIRSLFGDE